MPCAMVWDYCNNIHFEIKTTEIDLRTQITCYMVYDYLVRCNFLDHYDCYIKARDTHMQNTILWYIESLYKENENKNQRIRNPIGACTNHDKESSAKSNVTQINS